MTSADGQAQQREEELLAQLAAVAAVRAEQRAADRAAEAAARAGRRPALRLRRALADRVASAALERPAISLPALPLAEGRLDWAVEPTVDGVSRAGLRVDPPHRLAWDLELPERSAVRGWLALRPSAWGMSEAGVTLTVAAVAPGGAPLGAARFSIDPRRRDRDRRWVPWRWELPAAGPLRLELSVAPHGGASADYCWTLLGDPALEVPGLPSPPPTPTPAPVAGADAPTIALLLPVHDPAPELLDATLASVFAQADPAWQLCIVDDGSRDPAVRERLGRAAAADPRVRLARHATAGGISAATNAALALADADFVATLDHDDLLDPGAVGAVRAELAADPGTDVLYSDNDLLAGDHTFSAALKPAWSPDLLRSVMYTLHLGVYRRSLVEAVGGWRSAFDGAQDHDLVLRLSERTGAIRHLPRVLYHWRAHAGSAALGELAKPAAYDRGRAAVAEHLQRSGLGGEVERLPEAGRYRVRLPRTQPVTVVIAVRPGEEPALDGALDHLRPQLREGDRAVALPLRGAAVTTPLPHGSGLLAEAASLGEGLARLGATLDPAAIVLVLEAPVAVAAGDAVDELAGHVEAGAAVAGGVVTDPVGRVLAGALAFPAGVPIPVHADATIEPGCHPSLTIVSDRSAVRGAVALRAGALADPTVASLDRLAAAAASAAAGGRVVFSPHARFAADGAPAAGLRRWPAAEAPALARGDRRDPFWNPQRWADRGDESYPDRLHEGALERPAT